MRYPRSWLFRIGLASTVAGVAAAFILRPTEIRWASFGEGVSDAGFSIAYADYDVLPEALTLTGLAMMAVAVIRTKPGAPN